MEIPSADTGIKIYTTTPPFHLPPLYPSPPPPPENAPPAPAPACGMRRSLMAKGVQKTLSKTSMLANFLPTGTLISFEMVLPSVYGKGQCSHVTTHMTYALLALCTASCFFFHFTDSFRGPDGKVYYGFVTPRGLAVFKTGLAVQVPDDKRFRMGLSDFVHALMSVLVFVAIALSDQRVTGCLFPGHTAEVSEVMESFPLMVGIICSTLFLLFPNTRFGIGCGSP
ncbi:protein DMP9-like [Andrographis paniculata]|uniref:protein DMP9-like n=1 Tax=Andrographis paniculata TaxID=175694 RepID=UPI0021E9635F|nr:protein DMP9-like [Andrographis paniculata]